MANENTATSQSSDLRLHLSSSASSSPSSSRETTERRSGPGRVFCPGLPRANGFSRAVYKRPRGEFFLDEVSALVGNKRRESALKGHGVRRRPSRLGRVMRSRQGSPNVPLPESKEGHEEGQTGIFLPGRHQQGFPRFHPLLLCNFIFSLSSIYMHKWMTDSRVVIHLLPLRPLPPNGHSFPHFLKTVVIMQEEYENNHTKTALA